MANKVLFPSIPGKALPLAAVRNEAGGRAYEFSARHKLAQYAATGCLNSTYYASAQTQLDTTLELAAGVESEFVAKTALYCRTKGFMKDMPALLCAHLATRDLPLLERIFDRVIDNGKMLRSFVQIVRSGVTGRKSLGSAPKRLVRQWLAQRSDEQVFRASVGQSPSLADIIKMVHPAPTSTSRTALYGWLLGRPHSHEALPASVQAFNAYQRGETTQVPAVPFQMLTALNLGPAQWRAIARDASWQMTRMNLNTFERHQVFEDQELTTLLAQRLRNADEVRRARCFPYQLLTTFQNAQPSVPAVIREALQDAMEVATENVPAFAGQVVVCPDVSGSMHSAVTGYRQGATTRTKCVDVAALVTATVLRKQPSATVLPFSDDVVQCPVNPRDSVLTNARLLAALPSGVTACSAPLRWLNKAGAAPDLVLLISDNMSWVDSEYGGRSTATMAEWAKIKARNPAARLICLDLQPYGSTQADDREDILNVGGFSDAVFEVIAAFAAGELTPAHWVGRIEQTVL